MNDSNCYLCKEVPDRDKVRIDLMLSTKYNVLTSS
jgi:hypothetical protein